MFASFVLVLCQYPIRELALHIIDPSEEVGELAVTYFNICIYGAPASFGLFALAGWYVGMQNTRIPMVVAVVQNVGNILLSLIFVFGLHMKVEGVALGTILAQYLGFFTALFALQRFYIRRLYKYLPYNFFRCFSPSSADIWNKHDILKFLNVNKDIFFRTCCLVSVHFAFIAAGSKQGDTELAVNTLLMQLFTLYSYITDGFAAAGEAIAGKAIGNRNKIIYDDVVKRLFIWGTILALLFTSLYAAFGNPFFSILTDDAEVLATAREYQPWTLLIPICGMAAFIWDGIFIGATATRMMLISMAIGVVTFFCLYVILIPYLGNHGLWIAYISYLATRGIVQTIQHKIWNPFKA